MVYSMFGWLIGGNRGRSILVKEYIRPKEGDYILDLGCGPGDLVAYLPPVEYLGIDASDKYIQAARRRFAGKATFFCEQISTTTLKKTAYFDIVLALGLLHHLNDEEARQLFQVAMAALKPTGRLITLDGVFVENQSAMARWIISKDRGQYVRSKEDYLHLAAQVFPKISVNIRHDLLQIPYTHIILECTR